MKKIDADSLLEHVQNLLSLLPLTNTDAALYEDAPQNWGTMEA